MKLINPDSTEIFLWERTKKPEQLLHKIRAEKYRVAVLFPADDQELENRRVTIKPTAQVPAFIILDGTWKEARRILRKSDYLKELPLVSLVPNFASHYSLRKGAPQGNLCMVEAAIEVLRQNNEGGLSEVIEDSFDLFLKSYQAGASGHELKE